MGGLEKAVELDISKMTSLQETGHVFKKEPEGKVWKFLCGIAQCAMASELMGIKSVKPFN